MENPSIWRDASPQTSYPQLSGDLNVDVAIIGGGITGLTAAYLLSKSGKSVAVVEARKIGEGATGFSTGNLYATIGGEGLHNVGSKFDANKMKEVVESRTAAIDLIEQIIINEGIECSFERVPWTLFSVDGKNASFVIKEKEAAEEAGLKVFSGIPYPMPVSEGFSLQNQAQFNPLKYVTGLAATIQSAGCQIFENTRATDIKEGETCVVETTAGNLSASQVIMATHTPKGIYFVHTLMETYREYAVGVTLNGEYPNAGVYWEMQSSEHYSVRTSDSPKGKILMALGQMHKVGLKEDNTDSFDKLEAFLRERFDVANVEYRWSAQQFKPADGIPYIGKSFADNKTYIATGFAADGLTYGTLAAMIISDQIQGVENPWSKTYDASRITPLASASKFAKENVTVAYELAKDWLFKEDAKELSEVQPNEGKVIKLNGTKCAVHRDESGGLHAVSAVCPHMGCIVHWNAAEKSWDCPCHGSRFAIHGEVLEGPAYNPLKKLSQS